MALSVASVYLAGMGLVGFLLGNPSDRDHAVIVLHLDQPDALGRPADCADAPRQHPEDFALFGDQHQLVLIPHVRDADHLAIPLATLDVNNTYSTP